MYVMKAYEKGIVKGTQSIRLSDELITRRDGSDVFKVIGITVRY